MLQMMTILTISKRATILLIGDDDRPPDHDVANDDDLKDPQADHGFVQN